MKELKKVLVAEDHKMFREGLVKQINEDWLFSVCAEAVDGIEALEMIRHFKPDIVLLDISMPRMNGLEVARTCVNDDLAVDIIILTMYTEEEYFNAAMDIGVKGYILKSSGFDDLKKCLDTVSDGGFYVSPQLSEYVVNRQTKKYSGNVKGNSIELLTKMERKILRMIADAKTSKEIAEELFISRRTEEKHRENISNKLEIKGSGKLIKFAIENRYRI